MKRVTHVLRYAIGAIDLCHPLRHLPEHAAIVDFLEGFALDHIAADLADEQNHRRRILKGGVHADRRIAGPRPAGDKADARLAGHLAVRVCHVGGTAFVTTHNQLHGVAPQIQAVQCRKKTFAGHAKDRIDAMADERVNEDVTAYARRWMRHVQTPKKIIARRRPDASQGRGRGNATDAA